MIGMQKKLLKETPIRIFCPICRQIHDPKTLKGILLFYKNSKPAYIRKLLIAILRKLFPSKSKIVIWLDHTIFAIFPKCPNCKDNLQFFWYFKNFAIQKPLPRISMENIYDQ